MNFSSYKSIGNNALFSVIFIQNHLAQTQTKDILIYSDKLELIKANIGIVI